MPIDTGATIEMPVNGLQQAIAGTLVGLGGHGSKLWVLAGAAVVLSLVALSLAPLVSRIVRAGADGWLMAKLVLSDVTFIAVAILGLVILRLPGLSQLQLTPDEGGLILGARTLLIDPRFWISFENTTLGPLSTFSLVPLGWFGLPIDFTTIRVVGVVIWSLVIVMMSAGMKHLYGGDRWRILVLPIAGAIIAMNFWDYVAFNGEHMAVLMLAAVFWLSSALGCDATRVQRRRAFALGIALALVPLAKIQPGPIALVWGIVLCLQSWRICRPRVAWLVAGAACTAAVLGTYLFVVGGVNDFWQSYVLNNVLYASVGWNATQQDTTFWQNVLVSPAYFLKVPDTAGFFIFALVVAPLVAVVAAGSRTMRARLSHSSVIVSLLLVLTTCVCVLMPKNNWTHYLLLLIVPVGMFQAALLAAFFDELRERHFHIAVSMRTPEMSVVFPGQLCLAFIIAAVGVMAPAAYSMQRGHPANGAATQNLQEGRTADRVTAAILRYVRPGEPVAHWGVRFSQLTRAGVALGTRDAHIERALYPSVQQQYYLDRFVKDVLARRPAILVDTNDLERYHRFRLEHFPEQWAPLSQFYEQSEEVDGFRIFRRRP